MYIFFGSPPIKIESLEASQSKVLSPTALGQAIGTVGLVHRRIERLYPSIYSEWVLKRVAQHLVRTIRTLYRCSFFFQFLILRPSSTLTLVDPAATARVRNSTRCSCNAPTVEEWRLQCLRRNPLTSTMVTD